MPPRGQRPAIRLLARLCCAVAAACAAASCTQTPDPAATGVIGILRPERLAIHPLTRFGVDAEGKPVIVCHFELRDDYSQPVRSLGIARVELFRPGGSSSQFSIRLRTRTTPLRSRETGTLKAGPEAL